jgi:DNA polymerase-3 subunit epsilon
MEGISLRDLKVLILDCQATHSNPSKGTLFEIGWLETRPSRPHHSKGLQHHPECHLLEPPEVTEIPNHIRRITGLKSDDFSTATVEAVAWNRLSLCAARIAEENWMDLCPTVIHFARYEEPYLRMLHERYDNTRPFQFNIICTHTLIRQLLPHLPRKSLRAVAGYFGHTVPEHRRSEHHVVATAVIWKEALKILEEEHGVRDIDDLSSWMSGPDRVMTVSRSSKAYPMDPGIRLGLPDEPGVYRMVRSNGDVLYVGKAKSLKRRVNSYFQKGQHHRELMLEMLTQAADLRITRTGTALEAALLESDEIKRLSPPYNRALRIRERTPGFYTRDLQHRSDAPDDLHPVGPVPKIDSLGAVSLLGRLVGVGCGSDLQPGECARALDIPAALAPGADTFAEGFALLMQRYDEIIPVAKHSWRYRVQTLGRRLYAARSEAASSGEDEENGDSGDGDTDAREWTPDRVVAAMEYVIMHAAHLIRRGRWLCMLSDSVFAWAPPAEQRAPYRVLVIVEGAISDRLEIAHPDEIPIPPGYGRSLIERQRSFSIATYDRMRVLSSEMRRLAGENRSMFIRLNPSVIMNHDNLMGAFRWL